MLRNRALALALLAPPGRSPSAQPRRPPIVDPYYAYLVEGRVLDEHGRPAAGVTVERLAAASGAAPYSGDGYREVTDALGRFRFYYEGFGWGGDPVWHLGAQRAECPGAFGTVTAEHAPMPSSRRGGDVRTGVELRLPACGALDAAAARVGPRLEDAARVAVRIEGRDAAGRLMTRGTGTALGRGGLVLTAVHVVANAGLRYRVRLSGGWFAPSVVARDAARDVVVLRVAGAANGGGALPLATRVTPGQTVVCAGFGEPDARDALPLRSVGAIGDVDYTWSQSSLRPSPVARWRWHRAVADGPVVEHPHLATAGCAIFAGMSGGPVLAVDTGELVGLVVAGGVITPAARLADLLPGARRDAPAAASSQPSGAAAMFSLQAGAAAGRVARSVVRVNLARGHFEGVGTAPGVVVSRDGLVVVPAEFVRDLATGCAALTLDAPAGARCLERVAVAGEVALLRFDGLTAAEPVSAPAPEAPRLGQPVITPRGTLGFVTGLDRRPGEVLYARSDPPGGCGTRRAMWRAAHPPVEVARVLAHDAPTVERGELVVDALGRPVALGVAQLGAAMTYAIPWREVLARLPQIPAR